MKWFLFISVLFLYACSNLPDNIKNPPTVDIQLNQVLQNSSDFQNHPVRWGGTIIDVKNKANSTLIQILSYPLDYFARPKLNQPAIGRFISISNQFLDPAIFAKGTKITIAGTLQGTVEKKVDEKIITIPIIAIDNHHIWPHYRQNYYRPYGYYPYFNYGGGFYPYHFYGSRYFYDRCY